MSVESMMRQRVAELSASEGGYGEALNYISFQIERIIRGGAPERQLLEGRIIRAEVLQKLGNLEGSRRELALVNPSRVTSVYGQGYLLIKAKLLMQRGDIKASKVALQNLQDKLKNGSSTEIHRTFLWRQAFTLAVLGEGGQAARLADEHKDSTLSGGFHQANNIIYTRVLPALAVIDDVGRRWRDRIDAIRCAGTFYATSTVDFSGRLGHRGKSLCQALLAEAIVLWILGNRLNGYRAGFTAALLLRRWNLGFASEGVGEIVAVVDQRASALVEAVRFVLERADDTPVLDTLSRISAGASAEIAYLEAMEAATEIAVDGRLGQVYDILDEWR